MKVRGFANGRSNISHWPDEQVETLRRVLKGEKLVGVEDTLEVVRSLPHGHVAAVLGTLRELKLEQMLDRSSSRKRDLVVAMIAARVLDPQSKLATARGLNGETACDSLSATLGIVSIDEDDLYEAMDWLLPRQQSIEQHLAGKTASERWISGALRSDLDLLRRTALPAGEAGSFAR